VLVNHAAASASKEFMKTSVAEFQRAWAVDALGAFVSSQEAVDDMLETGGGTIIFAGATAAVRSLGGTVGFTVAKFVARGLAVDITQEFGPEGSHVAHVVLDGPDAREMASDDPEAASPDPDESAETDWHRVERDGVHTQPFEVHVTNGLQNTECLRAPGVRAVARDAIDLGGAV
jgi:NAD(P)-dependent dehydrogenase (short-subunit alcohol dehydrogenase family)